MNLDLQSLRGRNVLVSSAVDTREPRVALRGSIELQESPSGTLVGIVLEYPQMFQSRSHRRTIWLSDDEVRALVESERDGVWQFMIPGEL